MSRERSERFSTVEKRSLRSRLTTYLLALTHLALTRFPVPHAVATLFLFALGACVGSFVNVVVYRLPRVEDDGGGGYLASLVRSVKALSYPPSTCPRCGNRLAWRDNVPVLGWLILRGKCRYCGLPISARYPIVEAVCGLLFAGYYAAFFVFGLGPCGTATAGFDVFGLPIESAATLSLPRDLAYFGMVLYLLATLLAVSLIDAESYHIPLWPVWLLGIVGVLAHAFDRTGLPGSLIASAPVAACAAGGTVGLIISIALLRLGVLRQSFADGSPPLEVQKRAWRAEAESGDAPATEGASDGGPVAVASPDDHGADALGPDMTPAQVRAEMRHEMLFLMPPLVLAGAAGVLVASLAPNLVLPDWLGGIAGATLGGLVGGLVVWLTRILGSYAFGREAMGLGDVHLMAGAGACVGAATATVAFFLAPFFGLATAAVFFLTRRQRELPYGPYLSLAVAFVILLQCPILDYLTPGAQGLVIVARSLLGLGRLTRRPPAGDSGAA